MKHMTEPHVVFLAFAAGVIAGIFLSLVAREVFEHKTRGGAADTDIDGY
jgi:uncharacterized protein involved in cysteine biosynthesis